MRSILTHEFFNKVNIVLFLIVFSGIGFTLLNNSKSAEIITPKLPGDVDGNKVVDIDDLSLLLINWKKNYPQADFVKDNIIDIDDLSILLVNWGKTSTVTNYIFQDEFNSAAGTPADSSKWTLRGEICDSPSSWACPKNSNVFHDGNGNLILRTKRESANWLDGGPYSGAWLSTFEYGSGWPASNVKASLNVPYKIEMKALMPNTPGAWPSIWAINVDKPNFQNIYELDIAEQRMTYPTSAGCHQHTWLNGSDRGAWDGSITVSDMGLNWHVYSANVYADRVEYKVDGDLCGTAYGVSGRHGIILNNLIADPNSWGAGGQQPASTDTGPWDFKIDYIRASSL